MKKSILTFAFSMMLLVSGLTAINAQEQPAPKKDTVNMDTDAKPTQYYDIEDDKTEAGSEKGNVALIAIILGAVIVVGGAALFLLKKKK
ncbi:MAG: LPXTG cell wall anchor domain-containing protein [Bacteroidales bacterium]|jgi:LPXTG-motif cell wall-anchored protein|nr:LPXTG cell wall anchor domain-containing protein [Bacteroidales bacterium]